MIIIKQFLKQFFEQKNTMYSLEITALYSIVAIDSKTLNAKNFERENPYNFAFRKKLWTIARNFKGVVVVTNTPCFNQSSFEPPKPSTKLSMIVGLYETKAIDF